MYSTVNYKHKEYKVDFCKKYHILAFCSSTSQGFIRLYSILLQQIIFAFHLFSFIVKLGLTEISLGVGKLMQKFPEESGENNEDKVIR